MKGTFRIAVRRLMYVAAFSAAGCTSKFDNEAGNGAGLFRQGNTNEANGQMVDPTVARQIADALALHKRCVAEISSRNAKADARAKFGSGDYRVYGADTDNGYDFIAIGSHDCRIRRVDSRPDSPIILFRSDIGDGTIGLQNLCSDMAGNYTYDYTTEMLKLAGRERVCLKSGDWGDGK